MRNFKGAGYMRVVKISAQRPERKIIKEAARVIKKGGLVIFPTETVYGLGADAFNAAAVRRIFRVKGRPEGKPLIVHVAKKSAIDELARDVHRAARKLVKKFWPGPLTLVLNKRPFLRHSGGKASRYRLADAVTAGGDTVAIRMPNHPVALALIRAAGPLAAPSANLSGKKPPCSIRDISRALLEKVDLVLDAGRTSGGVPSTVIDLTAQVPIILRHGVISRAELKRAGLVILQ